MEIGYFESDIGILSVSTYNQEVISISFVDEIKKTSASPSPVLQKALKQIEEYFNGKRSEFDFPYRWVGTDFQVKIWNLVSRIPYGTSLAYVKVAQAYGDAKMVRAVAAALAKNPLIILIPCHRVMGSDGSLVGYSAGIDKKRQLLELEGFPKQIAVN